jgi:threonine dehydrogenase-like Zn-dependent dehydrogenase
MKALWLENHELSLRNLPEPVKPGEALIRIRAAGVCSTDLELVKGYYPFTGIPGHEFVGEVVSAPSPDPHPPSAPSPREASRRGKSATKIRTINSRSHADLGEGRGGGLGVGDRVVGEINVSCGNCEQCLSGRASHCENRTVLGITKRDGTFAEFTTLPVTNLHRVPASVPDEWAIFTEPLAAALEIQQQVHVRPADRVLVVGAGRLGQLIAQTLALTGCDLRVVARHAHQHKILVERGIRTISEEDIQPWRWDIVIEATGSPGGFSLARQAIRPRGTLVLKSTYKGEMAVNFSSIVVDEVNIVGSRCGPFEPALRLMEKGEVDPSALVTAEFKLDEALQAFERAAQTGVLKVLVRP